MCIVAKVPYFFKPERFKAVLLKAWSRSEHNYSNRVFHNWHISLLLFHWLPS